MARSDTTKPGRPVPLFDESQTALQVDTPAFPLGEPDDTALDTRVNDSMSGEFCGDGGVTARDKPPRSASSRTDIGHAEDDDSSASIQRIDSIRSSSLVEHIEHEVGSVITGDLEGSTDGSIELGIKNVRKNTPLPHRGDWDPPTVEGAASAPIADPRRAQLTPGLVLLMIFFGVSMFALFVTALITLVVS